MIHCRPRGGETLTGHHAMFERFLRQQLNFGHVSIKWNRPTVHFFAAVHLYTLRCSRLGAKVNSRQRKMDAGSRVEQEISSGLFQLVFYRRHRFCKFTRCINCRERAEKPQDKNTALHKEVFPFIVKGIYFDGPERWRINKAL